jgi:hypothetical protein
VQDLEVLHFRANTVSAGDPAVRMNEVQDVLVALSRATAGQAVFLEVSGSSSENIQLSLNRIDAGVKEVHLTGGAKADVARRLT